MEREKFDKILKYSMIVIIVVILATFLKPWVTIGPGERGVVTHFGKVQEQVLGEGIHGRIPIYEKVISMDVKVTKTEVNAAAVSKDLQTVSSKVVLNYHIVPDQAANLYQKVGLEFPSRIIAPAMQESIKAATALYTAEELVTKRQDVAIQIRERVSEKIQPYGIMVDALNMTNFEFSKEFDAAIEAKQVAEQNALRAKRDLERIKVEAEQRVASAKAEAEALKLQREQLTPQLIQKLMIERWDGHYPSTMVTGDEGVMPIINIPQK